MKSLWLHIAFSSLQLHLQLHLLHEQLQSLHPELGALSWLISRVTTSETFGSLTLADLAYATLAFEIIQLNSYKMSYSNLWAVGLNCTLFTMSSLPRTLYLFINVYECLYVLQHAANVRTIYWQEFNRRRATAGSCKACTASLLLTARKSPLLSRYGEMRFLKFIARSCTPFRIQQKIQPRWPVKTTEPFLLLLRLIGLCFVYVVRNALTGLLTFFFSFDRTALLRHSNTKCKR